MISSIIDMVLLAALAATSGSVLMMYRRLQRFDALQGQAAREFARSSDALDRAREALVKLQADGGEVTVTLAARLNEARMLMNDIEQAASRANAAFMAGEAAAAAARAAARPEPRHVTEPEVPAARRGPRPAGAAAAASAAPAADAAGQTTSEMAPASEPAVTGHAAPSPALAGSLSPDQVSAATTHESLSDEAAALGLGKPSAVERIRAAARGNARPSDPIEEDDDASGRSRAEDAAQGRGGRRPAAAADGASARRWTPPRATKTWTPPGQQPNLGRWAAAALAEGRLQPTVAAAAVNWRDVAGHAARPT